MRCIALLCAAILLASSAHAADEPKSGDLVIDKEKKSITVSAKIAPRKLPKLDQIYPIEVVATTAEGQKAHETVVTYAAKPSDIHKALESLGLKAGKPAKGEGAEADGPEVKISLEVADATGAVKRIPIEKTIVDKKSGKALPALHWKFTGSSQKQVDPNKPDTTYAADLTGTLIAIFPVTDETVFQTNLTLADEKLIKMETNTKVLPAEGAEVKLIIEVP